MEAFEVAIMDLIQTYCRCPVDNAKFLNSTSSCTRGIVTFSSTLAHASDDGTVIATTLTDTFEAAIVKEESPTIMVDGKELAVSMQVDEDDDSSSIGTTGLFFTGFSAATLVYVFTSFIIIW